MTVFYIRRYYGNSFKRDHNITANPGFRKSEEKRLARLQHILSRKEVHAKKEGRSLYSSKNYQKLRRKIAKLQRKIARRRNDFQDNLSASLIKSHEMVCAEDLKVKNLSGNHKLAKAIQDASWGSFLLKLSIKANMYGTVFIKVPSYNTTQTCSNCGHVLKGKSKLTLSDREWVCPTCGVQHDRDHNAAKNILAKGMAAFGRTA